MKLHIFGLTAALALSGVIASAPAAARIPHGGGGHVVSHGYSHDGGHHYGSSHGGYGSHFAPYAYLPYGFVVYSPPGAYYSSGAYIEQAPSAARPAAPSSFWYYCAGSTAYYPYVDSCPGGWQRVVPHPPPPY